VLPVLELPASDVRERLDEAGARTGSQFPYIGLLRFAIRDGSAYWKELAVGWVEALGVADETVIAELEQLARTRSLPQNLRHQVRKLLHRLARST